MRTVTEKWVCLQSGAEWSGVCAAMKQPFVDLARQHINVVFVHCDVDRLPKLAQKYAATRVPTYSFFWNGNLEAEFAGASERKLRDVLQDCLDLGPLPKVKESAPVSKKTSQQASTVVDDAPKPFLTVGPESNPLV